MVKNPKLRLRYHNFMYNWHHIKLYYYGASRHEKKMEKHKSKAEKLKLEITSSAAPQDTGEQNSSAPARENSSWLNKNNRLQKRKPVEE
ncbi:hypothetical protein MM300_14570 [Evansella sp. LMS18]|uniref:hypothetical protein n=1 Tax=Evansella sp. LMS18 TaxID=2924033 RepID=UPI0020D1B244|nr:hypothetical protein [Evansella sp. LMS18]UTR09122.1 hypothetical protein MM300_14570 [Evansella sp. LMS18]